MIFEEKGKKYISMTFDRVLMLLREKHSRKARRWSWINKEVQWPFLKDLSSSDITADDWIVFDSNDSNDNNERYK